MAGQTDAQALLLTVSADTSKALKSLDQLNKKLSGFGDQAAKSAAKAGTSLDRFFGKADGAKALDKIFDRSRLATFELGASKIPIFGSAIEALGPAGVAAAVGLGAVTVAAEQARKAMEWADVLEKTAQKLGTSTDALQKFDYAAVASSIGIEAGRETLGEFNAMIGKFETHTGDVRIKRWADAIKLSRDQINATIDPVEKLALVMERISTLSDTQSRTAAAKAFGLDGLLPIINGGKESINGFIAKMKEAQAAGGVIGAADIARAAEMNDKVEALSFLIGQHMREAFLAAAPAIERVAEFIEKATRALGGFLAQIPDAIRGMEDLARRIPHLPKGVHVDVGDAAESVARGVGLGPGIDAARAARGALEGLAQRGRAARLADGIADLMAGKLDLTGTELGATRHQGAGKQLTFDPPKKGKKGPEDDTAQKADEANAALDGATRAMLLALGSLTSNAEARGDFERRALIEEAAQQKAGLQKKIDALAKDKGITESTKVRLGAEYELAKLAVDEETQAKQDKLARDTRHAIEDRDDDTRKELSDALLSQLDAAMGLATTQADRNIIEREILRLKQLEAQHLKAKELSNLQESGAITDAEGDKRFAAFLDTQRADRQRQSLSQEDPIQRYTRSIQDLNTIMQSAAVTAAQDLSTGLADAIVNAKSLGDVAGNVFKQLISQLLAAAIEKDISGPILAALAVVGLADGGRVSGPGTGKSDSIPAMLSNGEFVVNAEAASKHAHLLEAINSGKAPRFAMGGPVGVSPSIAALGRLSVPRAAAGGGGVVQNFYPDFRGAVVTQELIDGMKAYSRSAASSAASGALRQANKSFPARQRAYSLLGTT